MQLCARIFQSKSHLLLALTYTFEQLIYSNSHIAPKRTIFCYKGVLKASFPAYLFRISHFLPCSFSCYIIALALLDRLASINSDYILNERNIHRLFMIALIIAIKMNDDQNYSQYYYEKVSGIKIQELNLLQRTFLQNLNYKTLVSAKLFKEYADKLEQKFQTYQREKQRSASRSDASTIEDIISVEDIKEIKQREGRARSLQS